MIVNDLLSDIIDFESPNVFNPWSDDDELDRYQDGHGSRVSRLLAHFYCKPKFLLVGEAPGYQGCHFSGVPFTNEALILKGRVPRIKSEGRITSRVHPWSEPSATIVWRTLHELQIAEHTVLWNAFAWHPHKPGDRLTNRAPTKDEIKVGGRVLRGVVDHFSGARVIAVGNVAEAALKRLGVIATKVRHPSMGGANVFREQMIQIAGG